MQYKHSLINVTSSLESSDGMYSMILLKASSLSATLSGVRCWLDGHYLLCLSQDDTVQIHNGNYEAVNLQFLPYFYNVNLNHKVINHPIYETMRQNHGYPDFHLFKERDDGFCGILSLSSEEYKIAKMNFERAKRHIEAHEADYMWSCRTRSDMISILRIAEGAYLGEKSDEGHEIIRYIWDNIGQPMSLDQLCRQFNTNRTTLSRIIKELTGLSPMQYVLEERLNQSRPDLLFTDIPISEIAEKYGFLDDNYYIRVFKKRFGKSPLQYRIEGRTDRIKNQMKYQLKED